MKTFKFFAALMLAVVCVGLSSCSKDDDEKNDTKFLVGTWIADDGSEEITFNADGTGFTFDKINGRENFTYTFDAKTMVVTYDLEKPDLEGNKHFTTKLERINNDKISAADGLVYTRKK